jgi:hypothetical protein
MAVVVGDAEAMAAGAAVVVEDGAAEAATAVIDSGNHSF